MGTLKSVAKVMLVMMLLVGFTATASADVIVIKTPPPAVKVEFKPVKPFRQAIWIPGHWTWKRGHYVWVSGYWVKARHGYVWVPGHWVKRHRGWVWVRGHWRRR